MNATPFLRATLALTLACAVGTLQAQTQRPSAKRAVRAAAPVATTPMAAAIAALPPATVEQIAAAARAYFGSYQCEFNQSVSVDPNLRHAGYVDVKFQKSLWTMKPVLSGTGALRLEDVKGRMMLLQIASKSMLMDAVQGRRVIDNCVHDQQRNVAPPPASESLGIDPALAAAAAAATAAGSAMNSDASAAPPAGAPAAPAATAPDTSATAPAAPTVAARARPDDAPGGTPAPATSTR
ncbi:MAG TPA: hypothetical protein PKJ45_10665 [Rubrivivax sp.]|nr:hypothetical protein [Rubrivivax sp.]